MANVFDQQWDEEQDRPPFSWRRARRGRQACSRALGASLFELPPGSSSFPLRVHHANEEMLIVLAGWPSLQGLSSSGRMTLRRTVSCKPNASQVYLVAHPLGRLVNLPGAGQMRTSCTRAHRCQPRASRAPDAVGSRADAPGHPRLYPAHTRAAGEQRRLRTAVIENGPDRRDGRVPRRLLTAPLDQHRLLAGRFRTGPRRHDSRRQCPRRSRIRYVGLHRVEIRAAVDNTCSYAIPGRLGFTHEGVAREAERIGDRYVDQVVYSTLADEWVEASRPCRAEHREAVVAIDRDTGQPGVV
jgi:hypothetical protein